MADIELPRRIAGSPGRNRQPALPDAANVPQVGSVSDPGLTVPKGAFEGVGAGLEKAGEAITSVTDSLTKAAARMQSREEAVSRARDVSSYNEVAHTEYRRIQTEDDLSRPETLAGFGKFLSERQNEIIQNHRGSEESRLRLLERLESIRFTVSDQAAVASVQAQRKLVDDTWGQHVNQLVSQAHDNPDRLMEMFDSLDGTAADMAPAFTPDEERARTRAAREQIAVSAVGSLLDRGAVGEAKRILAETPGLDQIIGPEAGRKLRSRITVAEATEAKALREGEMKLRAAEAIVGRPLKPEERAALAGIAPREGRQTLSQRIVDLETALGRPLSEPEIAKLGGIVTQEDRTFGTGITGRALEVMTDDAPAFAAGLLTPEQDRRFLAAVTQYTQPSMIQNPDTGLMETRRPSLPPFVSEALRRRGVALPQPGMPTDTPSPAGSPEGGGGAHQPAVRPGQTLWGLAGLATGPIPAIGEAVGRTPLIGDLVPAQQMTQARNFIPALQRDLVRVLQNNPRYAEGERKAIEQDINIEPKIFDNPTAFRNRLVAVDQALEIRQRTAIKTLDPANRVGREERVQAMNVLNALTSFRESLGVPVRVKSPDEARKMIEAGSLRKGEEFIDHTGQIRVVK